MASRVPSSERGEVTDKGTINGRAFISNDKGILEALYSEFPQQDILVF
jgi:hypothetical protein